jgi:hypothetical protein
MFAIPSKADITEFDGHVRSVPLADFKDDFAHKSFGAPVDVHFTF